MVDGIDRTWKSVTVWKYKGRDQYKFSSNELNDLCGGDFSSFHIEIVVLIEQTIRFTLSRLGSNLQFHFNALFSTDVGIQKFFRDIRFEQRNVNDFFFCSILSFFHPLVTR